MSNGQSLSFDPDGAQALRADFDKPGRPLSDWQVLVTVWEDDEALQQACEGSFRTLVAHAYADLSTENTPAGPALSQTVWDAIEAAGYVVEHPKPIHFVKPRKKPGFFARVFGFGTRVGKAYTPRPPM